MNQQSVGETEELENLTMPLEELTTLTQSSEFEDIGVLTQNFH